MLKPYRAEAVEPRRIRGAPPAITTHELRQFGRLMVRLIREEIKTEWGRKGVPHSERFLKSFGYKIERNKLVVYSTWYTAAGLLEGRKPYRMTWLTRERGVTAVPIILPDGQLIIRSTPRMARDAWIHPGYARHTFVARALRKARHIIAMYFLAQATKDRNLAQALPSDASAA